MNGRYWLDRNLGATAPGFYNALTGDGDPDALGVPLTRSQASTNCPKGFRLPKASSPNVDEWDWVNSFVQYSGDDDPDYLQAWKVEYSSSPVMNWWIPTGNIANAGGSPYFAYENYRAIIFNGRLSSSTAGAWNASGVAWHSAVKVAVGQLFWGTPAVNGGSDGNSSKVASTFSSWILLANEGLATSNFYNMQGNYKNPKTKGAGTYYSSFFVRCIRED